jgi:flavin-dependent dehydrogenase
MQMGVIDSMSDRPIGYEVVIMGGGLAGLLLAHQLKRAAPDLSILVVERNRHPVPLAAHKVGESSVEVAAHYFVDVLGLGEHFKSQQLPKLGLRFFFTSGDNRDITQRVEAGLSDYLKVISFQIDRGKLENWLAVEAARLGVEFRSGVKVDEVEIDRGGHTVTLDEGGARSRVTARWLVDASGRPGILKRRLGLALPNQHDVNAAWFRVDRKIALDDWSADAAWRARVPSGQRWLSTNHLMGPGYWLWFIPLADDRTSIGLVSDARLVPFEETSDHERLMEWMRRHEPQAAQSLEGLAPMDFRVLKHFSHDCQQVYSEDRWFITGEAGAFLDPLYSPGSDFIAFSNTYVGDLILADRAGDPDLEVLIERANNFYLFAYRMALRTFQGQYPLMGNAQVYVVKQIWDLVSYWTMIALPIFHDKTTDWEFMARVIPYWARMGRLNDRMQDFFHDWMAIEPAAYEAGFVRHNGLSEFMKFNDDLVAGLADEEIIAHLDRNLVYLEEMAREAFQRASGLPRESIDPYEFKLGEPGRPGPLMAADPAREAIARTVTGEMSKLWLVPRREAVAEAEAQRSAP